MTGQLEGRKILLVEDEFFQARDIKALLEREGATVIGPASHAEAALSLVSSDRPDAALVDINLGGGANYETAHLLQREGVPFAFITGYEHDAIPSAFEAIPLLQKPASHSNVVAVLSAML